MFDSSVKYKVVRPDINKLLLVEPQKKPINAYAWIKENKSLVEEVLPEFGGILLRNFGLFSVSDFNIIAQLICPNLIDYIYRSTPRTKLGGKIYTATEYAANKIIPFHNENSYTKHWPEKILFFCALVASEGGGTPIVDSRRVYNKIDTYVREKFEKKGILYVRNYNVGIDLSWQEVFQTSLKEEVNRYCEENNIFYEWNNAGPELTTKQVSQASIIHSKTAEKVWFNQAHLFHLSALTQSDRETLISTLGEKNVPRNTFYGDGDAIEECILEHIREIYNSERISFHWQKGDVLILDNVLTAHGRETYRGERKIAVAMA